MDGAAAFPALDRKSLTPAADDFGAGLARVEAELQQLSRQFEAEFQSRFTGSTANPFAILQRLRKLEREIPELREECRALLSAKQELVDKANRALVANRQQLDALERKAGKENCSSSGSGEAFEAMQAAVREWNGKVGLALAGPGSAQAEEVHQDLNTAIVNTALTARLE